ncbi:hypothetical protein RhiirB3_449443 [Rhizophagus irregularis]|nr:hypothetical protein RhiirB3_449443 [Rhizophagus irregularis]
MTYKVAGKTRVFWQVGKSDVKYDEGVTDDGLDESSEDESDEDEDELMINKLGLQTPIPVVEMPPILPDMEITPVDHTNQSTTAKISVKNSQKDKKSSEPEATQILTGYEAVGEEQERIQDIIVYDILLYERNNNVHDILEEMTIATLWSNRKPCEFLMQCGASTFKIIQTSKGRRRLVAYFENWETTLKALDKPPVTLPSASKDNNELKNLNVQKKAKKSSKNKGGNKDNKEVLAEILSLLWRLVKS